jgi:hypothetical protein
MRITISYESGLQLDGIVLSVSSAAIRVAIRNWDDTAEFHFHEGRWMSEFGAFVNIDSLLVNSPAAWRIFGITQAELEVASNCVN